MAPLNWMTLYGSTLFSLMVISWMIYHESKLSNDKVKPWEKKKNNDMLKEKMGNNLNWKW